MASEMTTGDITLCIYCKKTRPSSREHVLQKALGGNHTIKFVCKDCNNGFSLLDQALAENSLISLKRAGITPDKMPVRLGGRHVIYDKGYDLWFETNIRNGMQNEDYPQIHRKGEHAVPIAKDLGAFEQLITLIDKKIEKGTLLRSHVKAGPPEWCTTPRIVGHRKDDLFVRAVSLEAGQEFLRWLTANWANLKAQFREQPLTEETVTGGVWVRSEMAVRPDYVHRAIAKTVFNFMADFMGAGFALRPEFDDIRDYITGKTIVHKVPVPKGEVAVDTRFVRGRLPGEKAIVPTKSHLVAIRYGAPNMHGSLTLYENMSFFVHLGKVAFHRMIVGAHEFSIDLTSHKALDNEEIARRLDAEYKD